MGIKSIGILFGVIREIGLKSFFKSLRFNVHYFGIKVGSRLPVFVSKNVYFKGMQGKIELDSIDTGHIRIGFGDVGIFDKKLGRTVILFAKGSTVVFNGSCDIGHGSKISVQNGGKLVFGKHFCITAQSTIVCGRKITFGERVLMSWDVQIMDTDFHKIYFESTLQNADEEIRIGNDVWINSRAMILKGCDIPDGCVVGAMSLCNKKYDAAHSLIAGVPAKIIKKNVQWQR